MEKIIQGKRRRKIEKGNDAEYYRVLTEERRKKQDARIRGRREELGQGTVRKQPKNTEFLITNELGHNKIYKTQPVIDQIVQFLAS